MKRVGYLFDKIRDLDNIKEAIVATVRGKKRPKRFKRYILRLEEYALKTQAILDSGDYSCLGKDREFDIWEGHPRKLRHIQAPRFFPDQIIHRAVCNVIEPVLLKGRDRHSYCAIKGRGTYQAFRAVRRSLKSHPNRNHCLKMDIRKFYPTADRNLCLSLIGRKIKDGRVMELCGAIVLQAKGKGLPIGYATSPRFAELMLESTDHAIREEFKIGSYFRYADDMVLIDSNRRKLRKAVASVREKLAEVGFGIKRDFQLIDLRKTPLDFVGYRYWKEGYVRIRKHIFSAILSLLRRVKRNGHATISQCESYVSRMAMFVRCGSKRYYSDKMRECLSTGMAKSIISHFAKRKIAVI